VFASDGSRFTRPAYKQVPYRFFGYSLNTVGWIMKNPNTVIGVDSMPAHFAGTIGTKTLALMGPTKPTVFTHIANVYCLQSRMLDCVGCHFANNNGKGFSACCDQGCSSIFFVVSRSSLADSIEPVGMMTRRRSR
jgi:hypothetical protein